MNLAQKFETESLGGKKQGHQAKSAENFVNTLAVTFFKQSSWILLKMFVLMISRSSLKLSHMGSKTRSPGQISRKLCWHSLISETRSPGRIKGKPCWYSGGHNFEVIIMNLAQNVCFDDFKVMYISLSSDFLKFFCLGQFLSKYWYYRVIFGTCEVFVFRSVSQ